MARDPIRRGRLSIWLVILAGSLVAAPPAAPATIPPECDGATATIVGTPGDDVIVGTDGDDVIVGLGGADRIDGGPGQDRICGGPGGDILRGGRGRDRIFGGDGNDVISGNGGPDRLWGGRGRDRLAGGPGSDDLRAGPGNDRLRGGAGADRLRGGRGWDHLDPGAGDDAPSACVDRSGPEFCSSLRDGTWVSLPGGRTPPEPAGPTTSVSIEVEAATGLDPLPVTRAIERILGDPRGWSTVTGRRFVRTTSDSASMHVLVATPATVDALCAPLRTNGWLSCRRGDSAVLNVDRWLHAVEHWAAPIPVYRAYLVNHEIGHILGFGHVGCPGSGRPAPVMQQQTKALDGCRPNGWPIP